MRLLELLAAARRCCSADASLSSSHSSRIKPAALSLPVLSLLSVRLPFIYKCKIFTFVQLCDSVNVGSQLGTGGFLWTFPVSAGGH